jgi:Asp-tRNA(Asn)/Glu-tRNA(Gln) amidotransferase A subunit family amidase
MSDMFTPLDVIVAKKKTCDFWREQPFVVLPDVNNIRPKSYHELSDETALAGKKIEVPKMYIGGHDPEAIPVHTRKSVIGLWKNVKAILESLGATVEKVDFPVVTNFEKVTDVHIHLEARLEPTATTSICVRSWLRDGMISLLAMTIRLVQQLLQLLTQLPSSLDQRVRYPTDMMLVTLLFATKLWWHMLKEGGCLHLNPWLGSCSSNSRG